MGREMTQERAAQSAESGQNCSEDCPALFSDSCHIPYYLAGESCNLMVFLSCLAHMSLLTVRNIVKQITGGTAFIN